MGMEGLQLSIMYCEINTLVAEFSVDDTNKLDAIPGISLHGVHVDPCEG